MLRLPNNQFDGGIPPELGGLGNLALLDLGENRLTGNIPPELGSLSNLVELHLDSNQLSGEIPLELAAIELLDRLELGGNQFHGCIPDALQGFAYDLENVGLGFCSAYTVPTPGSGACSNGVVVTKPEENPGLVSDCRILLALWG